MLRSFEGLRREIWWEIQMIALGEAREIGRIPSLKIGEYSPLIYIWRHSV